MSNEIDEEMTFTPLNPIEGLTADEIVELLHRCLEKENLKTFLRVVCNIVDYYGARLISDKTGLSRENLYKILRGDRSPSLQTVHKIIWALKSGAINNQHAKSH